MNNFFLPLWLPISIVVNTILFIIFFFVLQFMPLNAARIPGTMHVTRVTIGDDGNLEEVPPPTLPEDDIVIPPPPPPEVKQQVKQELKPGKLQQQPYGISNPKKAQTNTGLGAPDLTKKDDGISGKGKGKRPITAPAVKTHPGGQYEVPIGTPGQTGTTSNGTGTTDPGGGKGGATYGIQATSVGQAIYPKDALNYNRGGTVRVLVSVNEDGRPTDADISSHSGSNDLDNAARKAALRSTFRPALKNGQQVASTFTVTYIFSNGRVKIDY